MNRPNFLIVGAAKSGTTSLDRYLKQHPEVFLPEEKECRYFSNVKDKNINPFTNQKHTVTILDRKEYYDLFQDANAHAIGDISPDYLYYHKESIKKIKEDLGKETKIIIILRNPVQRAYSNYLHLIRAGHTEKSFLDLIEDEKNYSTSIWYGFKLIGSSFYCTAVEDYIKNFTNVKVIIFEEFIKNEGLFLKEISSFLGIDDGLNYKKPLNINKTGVPKSKIISNITKGNFPLKSAIKWILLKIIDRERIFNFALKLRNNNLTRLKLEEETSRQLLDLFRQDVENLEQLLNKDLSMWK